MTTLVTGATGFIGSFVARALLREGVDVHLTGTGARRPWLWSPEAERRFTPLDVTDRASVRRVVERVRPRQVLHLAAVADPQQAWRDGGRTFLVNVLGTLHLLDALVDARPERVLVAGSSAVLGAVPLERAPVDEAWPPAPVTPYGTSKLAQELLARQYAHARGLPAVVARVFNTCGPGESHDAPMRWARAVVELEKAGGGVLSVGDLSPRRDLTDVRDQARAVLALLRTGAPGETYNLCSGRAWTMEEVLSMVLAHARVPVRAERDPAIARPADEPVIWGRPDKLRAATGLAPRVPVARSLEDVLRHWRGEPVDAQAD